MRKIDKNLLQFLQMSEDTGKDILKTYILYCQLHNVQVSAQHYSDHAALVTPKKPRKK